MGSGCSKCCTCEEEVRNEQKITNGKEKTSKGMNIYTGGKLSDKEGRALLREFQNDRHKLIAVVKI